MARADQIEGMHLSSGVDPWTDASGVKWALSLSWQVIDGRAECIGLRLVSAAPGDDPISMGLPTIGTPLTTAVLRGIPLGATIERSRREIQKQWQRMPGQPSEVFERPVRPATLDRLADAAKVYEAAWQKGEPPTVAVQKHLVISYSAAAKVVARARLAGLLPKTARGRASATPTEKGKA